MNRSGLTKKGFGQLTKMLLRHIRLVPDEEIRLYYAAASGLVTDKKDAPCVACTLAVGAEIWSSDRHLKNPRIKSWTTAELIERMMK